MSSNCLNRQSFESKILWSTRSNAFFKSEREQTNNSLPALKQQTKTILSLSLSHTHTHTRTHARTHAHTQRHTHTPNKQTNKTTTTKNNKLTRSPGDSPSTTQMLHLPEVGTAARNRGKQAWIRALEDLPLRHIRPCPLVAVEEHCAWLRTGNAQRCVTSARCSCISYWLGQRGDMWFDSAISSYFTYKHRYSFLTLCQSRR